MANTKITTNVIADDAITTAKIADDAVGNDQLASGLTLGGNTAATLSTAAQPNITSVGTLTGLAATGDLIVTKNSAKVEVTESSGASVRMIAGGSTGYIGNYSNHHLQILTNSTPAMIIQNDGNVLIGKNTTAFGTAGVRIDPTNIQVTTAGTTAYFNRLSSDGAILDFYKDGTSVGTMFTNGGGLILKGASTSAPVQLQTHDGNEDIEVDPDGFIKMETAGVERLRIDSNGSFGINTSTPEHHLHVTEPGSSKEDGIVKIGGSAASLGLELRYDQSANTLTEIIANPTYTNAASLMKLCVDGDANPNHLVLNGAGMVGIGTTSPGATLHVDPAANVTTSLGSPLIKVGGDNSWAGNGSIYTIGFGYVDSSITNKSPAEFGFDTETNAGYTKGSLVFATRSATTNTAPTERMRISSDGYVTKSNHPCFVVHLGANATYSSGVSALNGTGWTSVHVNIGSHFSTTTGKFTAPVAGMYSFTVNLATGSGAAATTYWSAEIYVNTTRVLGGWNEHTTGYQRTEATYVRYLSVGDTVHAGMESAVNITILGNAGSSPGGQYSRFEGYLIG